MDRGYTTQKSGSHEYIITFTDPVAMHKVISAGRFVDAEKGLLEISKNTPPKVLVRRSSPSYVAKFQVIVK